MSQNLIRFAVLPLCNKTALVKVTLVKGMLDKEGTEQNSIEIVLERWIILIRGGGMNQTREP